MPYWDYATSPKIPAIAADAEITVKMPSGVYKVYDKKTPNPVWSYRVSLNGKATKFGDLGDLKLDGVVRFSRYVQIFACLVIDCFNSMERLMELADILRQMTNSSKGSRTPN